MFFKKLKIFKYYHFISIYSLSAISLLLLILRDKIIISSDISNLKLLAQLVFINILSSAFTDYISNNKTWFSNKLAIISYVIALLLALFTHIHHSIYIEYSSFVFASLTIAQVSSLQIGIKNYSFPNIIILIELFIQILFLLFFSKFTFFKFLLIRIFISSIILILIRDEGENKIALNKSINLHILNLFSYLILALGSYYFFVKVDNPSIAMIGRCITYLFGAVSLSFNIIADKISQNLFLSFNKKLYIYLYFFLLFDWLLLFFIYILKFEVFLFIFLLLLLLITKLLVNIAILVLTRLKY